MPDGTFLPFSSHVVFFLLFRNAVRMEKIERDLAALARIFALREVSEPEKHEKDN